MTIIDVYINSMVLTDCNRRTLYVRLTLLNRTFYLQCWPRDAAGWSCGYRHCGLHRS